MGFALLLGRPKFRPHPFGIVFSQILASVALFFPWPAADRKPLPEISR